MAASDSPALAARARAHLLQHGSASEDALLTHVYGFLPPVPARPALLEPLLISEHLTRAADGHWHLTETELTTGKPLSALAFTALVLAPTGGRPGTNRLAGLESLTVPDSLRYALRLNPEQRTPASVAQRLRTNPADQDHLPLFREIAADLTPHLTALPLVVQEPQRAAAFLRSEYTRLALLPPDLTLIGLESLADLTLNLKTKPTLQTLATHAQVPYPTNPSLEQECRVLAQVATHLLARAATQGFATLPELQAALTTTSDLTPRPLADVSLPAQIAETPGVYVMRDQHDAPLYVGKAAQLRDRISAYVARPIAQTRRLEGLAESTATLRTEATETDVEALVRETQEIERLQPRFNTVRTNRAPRLYLTLPTPPPEPTGKRKSRRRAPPRILLTETPAENARTLGPWRNTQLAESARDLARSLFNLDAGRHTTPETYLPLLESAWSFLQGDTEQGIARAQTLLAEATAARDHTAQRRAKRLLRQAAAYNPQTDWLPADPRHARYAVVRSHAEGIETLIVNNGILTARSLTPWHEPADLAVLTQHTPRTTESDSTIVLRWLGWQRPPAHLIHLSGHDDAPALGAAQQALLATYTAALEPRAEDL